MYITFVSFQHEKEYAVPASHGNFYVFKRHRKVKQRCRDAAPRGKIPLSSLTLLYCGRGCHRTHSLFDPWSQEPGALTTEGSISPSWQILPEDFLGWEIRTWKCSKIRHLAPENEEWGRRAEVLHCVIYLEFYDPGEVTSSLSLVIHKMASREPASLTARLWRCNEKSSGTTS